MADWGQKAKDKDRDDAIRVIEDAAARGQIVEVDKLKRIQEVQAAGTVGEIELVTRGLAAAPTVAASDVSEDAPPVTPTFPQYTPPTTPPVTEPDPTPPVPPSTVQYGEPLTPSGGTPVSTPLVITRSGGGAKWVLLVVLIVIAGIAVPVFFGIKSVVDTVNDGIDGIDGIDGTTPGDAEVFTEQGLDALADDLEAAEGSTEIFSATLYPGYAVLEVPAEDSGARMYRYYWNGELEQQSKGRAINTGRMDLRDVDVDVLTELRKKVRAKVEDSTDDTNYVIVHAPGATDEGAYFYAYASNDFGEGGYISADLDGKVIRTTTW